MIEGKLTTPHLLPTPSVYFSEKENKLVSMTKGLTEGSLRHKETNPRYTLLPKLGDPKTPAAEWVPLCSYTAFSDLFPI